MNMQNNIYIYSYLNLKKCVPLNFQVLESVGTQLKPQIILPIFTISVKM